MSNGSGGGGGGCAGPPATRLAPSLSSEWPATAPSTATNTSSSTDDINANSPVSNNNNNNTNSNGSNQNGAPNSVLEKPNHLHYMLEFRVEPCALFRQHQCANHRPYTCFNWHFANQRRRRPVKTDGVFNYSPDVYCDKYDENTGVCPDGDGCPYLHRAAGDVERKYHPRYYKTAHCVHSSDVRGVCVKNGVHCAFAHSVQDLRPPQLDANHQLHSPPVGAALDPEWRDRTSFVVEDTLWYNQDHVLSCYKTEPCRKPARLCRQGYACPFYHNSKDRRRPPALFKYRSTPCPSARSVDEWLEPEHCEAGDACTYCHTRTEQQFHPEIYKSTKCNDVLENGYCPRAVFCAFAHHENELHQLRVPYAPTAPAQQQQQHSPGNVAATNAGHGGGGNGGGGGGGGGPFESSRAPPSSLLSSSLPVQTTSMWMCPPTASVAVGGGVPSSRSRTTSLGIDALSTSSSNASNSSATAGAAVAAARSDALLASPQQHQTQLLARTMEVLALDVDAANRSSVGNNAIPGAGFSSLTSDLGMSPFSKPLLSSPRDQPSSSFPPAVSADFSAGMPLAGASTIEPFAAENALFTELADVRTRLEKEEESIWSNAPVGLASALGRVLLWMERMRDAQFRLRNDYNERNHSLACLHRELANTSSRYESQHQLLTQFHQHTRQLVAGWQQATRLYGQAVGYQQVQQAVAQLAGVALLLDPMDSNTTSPGGVNGPSSGSQVPTSLLMTNTSMPPPSLYNHPPPPRGVSQHSTTDWSSALHSPPSHSSHLLDFGVGSPPGQHHHHHHQQQQQQQQQLACARCGRSPGQVGPSAGCAVCGY